jgi:PAS domain S-box-containing protein
MTTPKSYEQLLRENELLRQRLEEPEATIEAIRHGEVDAVVVYGPFGEEIYTLEGADRPYRQLIEAMRQGAATVDRQGTMIYCNRYFADMLGKPKDELIGTPVQRLLVETEQTVLAEMLENAQLQESIRSEVRLRRGDDSAFPAELILHTLPMRGILCLIASDLTRQKQYEELIEARKELAEAGRRKDEFIAMLGHELRNPLAPLRGVIESLQRQKHNGDGLKHAYAMMDRQVSHLTRLVDDLLDVSRITRSNIELRKEPIDLARVVDHAVEMAAPIIESRRHELMVSLPRKPLRLEGDMTRLTQVFFNLLNNAAKYTEPGGRIWLNAEREDKEAVVRVRDNGSGVPPELLPKIFDLFAQGKHALGRSQGGLGLGLTLVRRLVEMHAGSVAASSAGAGKGSEFIVRLPLVAAEAMERPQPPLLSTPSQATVQVDRALVVDDNLDVAESLVMLLEGLAREIKMVHSGPEALDLARTWQPDVVLADIGMPGMDGYEVARRLRQEPGLTHVFLAAVSGYGKDDDRLRSTEAGFDCHLVKPIDQAALEKLLRSVAARQ